LSGQEAHFGSQPIANNACSLFVIVWPGFREAVIRDPIALDAEGALDYLGGHAAVVAVDSLFEKAPRSGLDIR
jgi:hypothetical protein